MTAVASLSFGSALVSSRARVNWFLMIVELEQIMTLDDIAKLTRRSKGTVCYWKKAGEPKHFDGENLKALYLQTFPGRSVPMHLVKNLFGT